MTIRRVPPHSRDSEESVLGGILFHGKSMARVAALLEPSDFYDARHEHIYRAMHDLALASQPIDIITVAEEMRRQKTISVLSGSGEEAYLSELANHNATTDHLEHHARTVREKATARALILELSAAMDDGYADQLDHHEYVSRTLQRVLRVMQRKGSGRQMERLPEVLQRTLDHIAKRAEGAAAKTGITGVPTGFRELDDMTAGLQPADLIVVAARPSMGKTAFALNIGIRAALKKIPVLVFSLEMKSESLVERLLSGEANIDSHNLRVGRLERQQWDQLFGAARRLSKVPITVTDINVNLAQLNAMARMWRSNPSDFPTGSGLGLIIIDYLGIMPAVRTSKQQSREREVSEICAGIKALAKDLDVPIMLLSQLNRGLESRQDKRPLLSDLRESGAIEQDADVVAFIHRECRFDPTANPNQAEIIIAKQRNGRTGPIELHFCPEQTRFEDRARREDGE